MESLPLDALDYNGSLLTDCNFAPGLGIYLKGEIVLLGSWGCSPPRWIEKKTYDPHETLFFIRTCLHASLCLEKSDKNQHRGGDPVKPKASPSTTGFPTPLEKMIHSCCLETFLRWENIIVFRCVPAYLKQKLGTYGIHWTQRGTAREKSLLWEI